MRMRRIARGAALLLTWFCVATMLAQAAVAGVLLWKVGIDRDRWTELLTVVYGIDTGRMRAELAAERPPVTSEQPGVDRLVQARLRESLDLQMRESAVAGALGDLRRLEARLRDERRRYDELRRRFDARLLELETRARDEALREVQQSLEAMRPRQAKDQIVRMLVEGERDEQAMEDVIAVIRSMPLDQRKRIFAEFRTAEENDRLHRVLERIRRETPEMTLIRETRDRLAAFPAAPPGDPLKPLPVGDG